MDHCWSRPPVLDCKKIFLETIRIDKIMRRAIYNEWWCLSRNSQLSFIGWPIPTIMFFLNKVVLIFSWSILGLFLHLTSKTWDQFHFSVLYAQNYHVALAKLTSTSVHPLVNLVPAGTAFVCWDVEPWSFNMFNKNDRVTFVHRSFIVSKTNCSLL